MAALPALGLPKAIRPVEAAANPTSLTPDEALARLVAGNARFAAGAPSSPNQTPARRASLIGGQSPHAVVLSCADSRVPPEIVFDEGLGDLFVVRVAGNAPSSQIIASIEYAVVSLEAPLIMVLGHSSCGAVVATVSSVLEGTPLPSGHLEALVAELAPAVLQVQQEPGNLADNAITRNVQIVVNRLAGEDPILSAAVQSGTLKIVGARYELESGVVNLLPRLMS
jgi:carbonic anhydrase